MKYGAFPRFLLGATGVLAGFLCGFTAAASPVPAKSIAQSADKDRLLPWPAGKDELLPLPKTVTPIPSWSIDPRSGHWTDPQGNLWQFDGLRWRVFWGGKRWYPVIPTGPLPFCWQTQDFGQGWLGILPPHSSIWHLIPPSPACLPPGWDSPLPLDPCQGAPCLDQLFSSPARR